MLILTDVMANSCKYIDTWDIKFTRGEIRGNLLSYADFGGSILIFKNKNIEVHMVRIKAR